QLDHFRGEPPADPAAPGGSFGQLVVVLRPRPGAGHGPYDELVRVRVGVAIEPVEYLVRHAGQVGLELGEPRIEAHAVDDPGCESGPVEQPKYVRLAVELHVRR